MRLTYDEVLDKIENSRRFGKLPGAEVTRNMLARLGEPMRGLPYIHVAGTNGKGSTCAFLDCILRKLGMKVGLFTSPHLVDFRERIVVDGEQISHEDVERIGNFLLEQDFSAEPTMFDYCLAMAVLYFREQHCDVAVIETGLGGRLDSTNALGTPEAAVITRIGRDHMSVLGNSIEEIAAEKAGIIKENSVAVIAPQLSEAAEVLHEYANHVDAKYFDVTDEDLIRAEGYHPGLLGLHQIENAAAAELAVRKIWENSKKKDSYFSDIAEEKLDRCIAEGIRDASWPGRMEILSENPFFMVDGAHNPDGARALADSLGRLYPGERFVFAMGVLSDKDYAAMIEPILPLASKFYTVTPDSDRALGGEKLAGLINNRGVEAQHLSDIKDLIDILDAKKRTVAFGSLYYIGDIEKLWRDRTN